MAKIDNYNDYDDYHKPNTSTIDETAFTAPSSTNKQATLTLRLRQKVKRDKLAALYRHLKVTGDLDLINLNRLNYTNYIKKGTTVLEFHLGDK